MNTWTLWKNLVKKKYLVKNVFTDLRKIKCLVILVKNLYGRVSDKEYLRYIKIWNEFNMKNMGGYYDHYLKKDDLLLADAPWANRGGRGIMQHYPVIEYAILYRS